MKNRLKFISYDGTWPNLCSGKLTVELDGKLIEFPKYILHSGGGAYFTNNYSDEHVDSGPWSLKTDYLPNSFPKELIPELTELINDNIPHGCCGGCL